MPEDARLTRRAAAVALATTGGLWHTSAAIDLGAAHAGAAAAGLLLAVASLTWTVWLIRGEDRIRYLVGAATAALTLAGSTGLLISAGSTPSPASWVGVAIQAALLQITLTAVAMSALVGGIGHTTHGTAATPPGRAPAAAYLCHLV